MIPPRAWLLSRRLEHLQEQADWCREYMRLNRMMARIREDMVELLKG